MEKRNALRIKLNLKSAIFLLADWRLSHPTELPGDLPVLLECHTLTMNMIELQLSDAVADINMLKCSAQFRILFINAHFVADNASHALAYSVTAKPIQYHGVLVRWRCSCGDTLTCNCPILVLNKVYYYYYYY